MNNRSGDKGWQFFGLNEICATRCGIFALSHPYHPGAECLPYIKPKDIFFNTIFSSDEYITFDAVRQSGVQIVPKESILIAVTGSNAGNIALLGKDAIVNQNVFYATIQNSFIRSKYLYYYLYLKRHLLVKVSRYAVRGSQRSIQKLQVPLPPLDEQDAIIEYLDLKFSDINISLENTKFEINEIDRKKQLVLNSAFFSGRAGSSRDGWDILQLKDCGLIRAGITPNGSIKEYYGSEYPLFKPTDFTHEMQMNYAETYLSGKGLKLAGFIKANSVVMCGSGTNLGVVKIIKIDGACSQQLISFTPFESLLSEFVYFQMNAGIFKEQLIKHAKNSAINLTAFKNLSIAVTGLAHQQNIVNKLQSEINLIEKKEIELNKKLTSLDAAKYKFLSHAFSSNLLAGVILPTFI